MAMQEVWRPIPLYGGHYDASNLGRIRSHHRGGRIKKPSDVGDGYKLVFLHNGSGGRHGHYVHRMVCMAFHGLPEKKGLEAAHLDGVRTNNDPSNLAWVTHHENILHKAAHGTVLAGERHPRAKLNEHDVALIWHSPKNANDIAQQVGISAHTVRDIRSGKRWREFTRGLPPQPERLAWNAPMPIPDGFCDAVRNDAHWSQLVSDFGISRSMAYRMRKACLADAPKGDQP